MDKLTRTHLENIRLKDKELQNKAYMEGLERRFKEYINAKSCSLIRYDILQSMRNIYNTAKDENISKKMLELIPLVAEAKYRAKYATVWKGA